MASYRYSAEALSPEATWAARWAKVGVFTAVLVGGLAVVFSWSFSTPPVTITPTVQAQPLTMVMTVPVISAKSQVEPTIMEHVVEKSDVVIPPKAQPVEVSQPVKPVDDVNLETVTPPAPMPDIPKVIPPHPEARPEPRRGAPIVKPKKRPSNPTVVKPQRAPQEVALTPNPVTATEGMAETGVVTGVVAQNASEGSMSVSAGSGHKPSAEQQASELAKLVAIVNANKVYPRRARQNNEEGRLQIVVRLDAKGVVREVLIAEPARSRLLRQAALKAAQPLLGLTTRLEGTEQVTVPIVFSLSES